MDHALKQRLTGALVIVIFASIVLPMLLDGGNDFNNFQQEVTIPPKPANHSNIKTQILPLNHGNARSSTKPTQSNNVKVKPVINHVAVSQSAKNNDYKPEIHADSSQLNQEASNVDANLATEQTINQTNNNDIVQSTNNVKSNDAKNWAVQVGGFSAEANALALRDKLRSAGFPAYVETFKKQKKAIYRVRIGPVITEKEAEKLKQKVNKTFNFKAIVVDHP